MSEAVKPYIFKNYSLVRCDSVERLNQILVENGRIICRDSKLSRAVEIKFLDDELDLLRLPISDNDSFKNSIKIEMIRKILET